MKIGYFTSKFPYDHSNPHYICGGSIFATQSLITEISKMGHAIKIFTTSQNSKNSFKDLGKIKIFRYGTNFKFMSSNLSIGLLYKPLNIDVDIVHTSFDIPPGPFAGLKYAKKKDTPLVVTYHGDWDASYGNFIRKLGVLINNKILVNDLLSHADIIISPSKTYVETSKFLSRHIDKIHVIPNGIDLEEFQVPYTKDEARQILNLPLNKKILLFLGYLSPYKSPDILLRSFAKVLKSEDDIILLFAGTGDMEDMLKIISRELNIENNVIFAGFIKKEIRALYYKSSDIFCLPSTMSTECYPLAILEAMASKIPVISSNIGGIPDIIEDEINGMLVPPNDEKELSNVILKLFQNPRMMEKISHNAFKNIKRYNWRNIAKETNQLYLELGESL